MWPGRVMSTILELRWSVGCDVWYHMPAWKN